MATFFNPAGNALGVGGDPVQVFVPATGNTIQLRRGDSFYIAPAATLAALTLRLPAAERGQECEIGFSQIITALSIRDRAGNVIASAPTAAAVNDVFAFKYVNKTIGWVKWI
jgi:hypothetical protein